MPTSLKTQTRPGVLAVVSLNYAIWLWATHGTGPLPNRVLEGLPGDITKYITPGVGLLAITAIADAFPSALKESIVFWKRVHPLPGTEAFSVHARKDNRIDLGALERQIGPFPLAPADQNAKWYSIYREFRDHVEVRQVHRSYLLYRDATAISVVIGVLFGGVAALLLPPSALLLGYIGYLIVQFFILSASARASGRRFVTTVLALRSSSSSGAPLV